MGWKLEATILIVIGLLVGTIVGFVIFWLTGFAVSGGNIIAELIYILLVNYNGELNYLNHPNAVLLVDLLWGWFVCTILALMAWFAPEYLFN